MLLNWSKLRRTPTRCRPSRRITNSRLSSCSIRLAAPGRKPDTDPCCDMLGCFVVVWMGCGGEIGGRRRKRKQKKIETCPSIEFGDRKAGYGVNWVVVAVCLQCVKLGGAGKLEENEKKKKKKLPFYCVQKVYHHQSLSQRSIHSSFLKDTLKTTTKNEKVYTSN